MSSTVFLLLGLLEGATDDTLDTAAVREDLGTVYLYTTNHDVGVILANTASQPWPSPDLLGRVVSVPFSDATTDEPQAPWAGLPESSGVTVPDAPVLDGSTFTFCGAPQVGLDWEAPDDGGSTILYYVIYIGEGDVGFDDMLTMDTTSDTEYSSTALDPMIAQGIGYSFAVTAVNAEGESAPSNIVHLVWP